MIKANFVELLDGCIVDSLRFRDENKAIQEELRGIYSTNAGLLRKRLSQKDFTQRRHGAKALRKPFAPLLLGAFA
jgi:hypothetical protein